jgi:hypothetical protein
MSPLQNGANTLYVPYPATDAVIPVLFKNAMICSEVKLAPIKVSAFLCLIVNYLGVILGVKNVYSPFIIVIGSTSKGFSQYSENAQIKLFKQTYALGLFNAVT